MQDLLLYFLTAFALIFVIEGLLYAVFPAHIQKMMAMASTFTQEKFRAFGGSMIAFGVLLVWLLQKL